MNKEITVQKDIDVLRRFFKQESLEVLSEKEGSEVIAFSLSGKGHADFSTLSCSFNTESNHAVVEFSILSRDSFPEKTMAALLELINILNIAEITAAWSITPDWKVELRGGVVSPLGCLDMAQLKKTLERFLTCASRCYPAIVDQAKGGKDPQDIMGQLVEENRDFFI